MTTTAISLDEIAKMHSAEECPMDNYDRYLIVPEGEPKGVPHTRSSTVPKAVDDGYGVADWTRRLTAVGFAQQPILFAKLCAADPDDKKKIRALCEEAKKAAGGDDARDNGTILHAFSEKVDRGQNVYMPDIYRADIEAYQQFLAERTIEIHRDYVERLVVLPKDLLGEPVAGRPDRYVGFGSKLMTFDLKTGSLGRWSWLSWCIQLAIYSRAATFYDPKTKTHTAVPEINQHSGMVCHLPYGQAKPQIYFVDLDLGWEAAQTAMAVRRWRKLGESGGMAEEWREDKAVEQNDVRRIRLVERITALKEIPGAIDILVRLWPEGVATFKQAPSHTADELNMIALAISTAEAKASAPFGALDPADSQNKGAA